MNNDVLKNKLFIILLTVVFSLLIFGSVTNYFLQQQSIKKNTKNYITNYDDYFNKTLVFEINNIHDHLDFIREKEELITPFLKEDKKKLYKNIKPIFDKLNKTINITHLYFIKKDSSVFLRVHDYKRDKDIINRFTFNKTKNSEHISYGLEFGVKKNFVLRLVHPWYYNNELIGYIEMGKEIDKIINNISSRMNLDIVFAINKSEYKNNNKNTLGKLHIFDKDQTNKYFIQYSTIKNINKELLNFIDSTKKNIHLKLNNKHYLIYKHPLTDVSNKKIGYRIVLINMTKEYDELLNQSIFYITLMTVGALLMVIIGYFFSKYYQDRVKILSEKIIDEKRLMTAILNSSNAVIATINVNGVMTNINNYGSKLVGYSKEEIASKPYFWFEKFIPSNIQPDIKELINSLSEDKSIISTKINPWIDKNGNQVMIEWSNSLLYDFENNIEGIITVGIDVSEKQKKEKELLEEKNKFQLLLNSAADGIHILDKKGNVIDCSHSFAKMLGYKKEEALKLNVKDWDANFEKSKILEIIDKLLKTPTTFETKHKRKDGSIYIAQITTRAIIIKDEYCLYASARDITIQKNAYEKLEKFIDLQDNIIVLTDGLNINYANKNFFELTKYKNLNEFKKDFKDISNIFIENENFFYTGKKNTSINWINEIQKLPDNKRIVAILGKNYNIHAFSLNINYFENNLYIVTLTDISQTIIEKVNLKRKTLHDRLTDAYNREYFEQNYQSIKNSCEKNNLKLGIAFFDIDHFKLVNDNFGHKVGDEVLIKFVNLINRHSRTEDKLIRWGGEEFIMILKVKKEENLSTILENIRINIQETDFPSIENLTCSIGATINEKDEEINVAINRADKAVYIAKRNGRNQLIMNLVNN